MRKIEESENLKVGLLNMELSGEEGLEALTEIKDEYPELIVSVEGAFNDARDRPRRIEDAHSGPFFLHEVFYTFFRLSVIPDRSDYTTRRCGFHQRLC